MTKYFMIALCLTVGCNARRTPIAEAEKEQRQADSQQHQDPQPKDMEKNTESMSRDEAPETNREAKQALSQTRPEDPAEATDWACEVLKSGADEQSKRLALALLDLHMKDPQVTQSQRAAAKTILETTAEKENPVAMLVLGNMYRDGLTEAPNYEEAIQWYQRAVSMEHPEAFARLGELLMSISNNDYLEGRISLDEADRQREVRRKLFMRGAELGDSHAKFLLKLSTPPDYYERPDYSYESMLFNAGQDALRDAAARDAGW